MSPDASQPGNCLSYAADTVACYQIVSNREPAACLLAARRVAVLGIRMFTALFQVTLNGQP